MSQKPNLEQTTIVVKEVLKEWNIEGQPVQLYHSAWSVNDSFVIKVYEDSKTLLRNVEMMKMLYEAGIPVPMIVPLPSKQDYLEYKDKLYVVTTKLEGKNLVHVNDFDQRWFFEFGRILAKLHIAFKEMEKGISFWNNSMLEEMRGWVSRDLLKFHPEYLKQEDITASISELEQVYDSLPKQLIHRDVHLGNFLFDQGVFSGYIDFDLSQSNIRIFDLGYFLLGLLLQEDSNRVEEDKWFEIIRQVMEGYDSLLELSRIEKGAVACVMKNIELLFTAYFLGIGDDESAKVSGKLFSFIKKNEIKIRDACFFTRT